MATPIQGFTVTYLDDSNPPVRFTPATVPERMRIRAIEVALVVDAPRARVLDGTVQTAEIRSRTVPRAILLTR
jgi:hypothetical protein